MRHAVLTCSLELLILKLEGLNKGLGAVLEPLLAGLGNSAAVLVSAHVLLPLLLHLPLLNDFQLLCFPFSLGLLFQIPVDPLPLNILSLVNHLGDLLCFALGVEFALLDGLLALEFEDHFFLALLALLLLVDRDAFLQALLLLGLGPCNLQVFELPLFLAEPFLVL